MATAPKSRSPGSPDAPLTPTELRDCLVGCLRAGATPLVLGAPGIGKTHIIHQVGKILDLPVKVILLAQREPVDFVGVPHVVDYGGEKRSRFAPPIEFIADKPVLLFLDEFLQAPMETQRAASEIILERTVGGVPLHPDSRVICASNRREDRAGTVELLGHNKSRVTTLHSHTSVSDWMAWASGAGVNPLVIQYIQAEQMNALYPVRKSHGDYAYPCPRSWEKVSDMLNAADRGDYKGVGGAKRVLEPMVIGTIGPEHGPQFMTWLSRTESRPTPAQIAKDPMGCPIPNGADEQRSFAAAIFSAYGDVVKSGARGAYKTYLSRFGMDQLVAAHSELTRAGKKDEMLLEDLAEIRRKAK